MSCSPVMQCPLYGRRILQRILCHMHITDEALREFITICKEDYGVTLPEGEARVCAMRLLLLFEQICKPLPGELKVMQLSRDQSSAGDPVREGE